MIKNKFWNKIKNHRREHLSTKNKSKNTQKTILNDIKPFMEEINTFRTLYIMKGSNINWNISQTLTYLNLNDTYTGTFVESVFSVTNIKLYELDTNCTHCNCNIFNLT